MIMSGACCATGHGRVEVLGDEGGPGLLQDRSGDLSTVFGFFRNEQLLEEELVGQAADLRAATPVDLIAATNEGQSAVQRVLDARIDHLCRCEGLLGLF